MSSASRKNQGPDVGDLTPEMLAPDGLQPTHCAEKGLQRRRPLVQEAADRVVEGLGHGDFDAEGRFIRADFGTLSVVSLYLPSGSSSPERQEAKFRFMDTFLPLLTKMAKEGREVIVCGDWNIAQRKSTSGTGNRTRRTPASCPRSVPG